MGVSRCCQKPDPDPLHDRLKIKNRLGGDHDRTSAASAAMIIAAV